MCECPTQRPCFVSAEALHEMQQLEKAEITYKKATEYDLKTLEEGAIPQSKDFS